MGKYIKYKNENGLSKGLTPEPLNTTTKATLLQFLAGVGVIGAMVGLCQIVSMSSSAGQTVKETQFNDTIKNSLKSVYMVDDERNTR